MVQPRTPLMYFLYVFETNFVFVFRNTTLYSTVHSVLCTVVQYILCVFHYERNYPDISEFLLS